MHENLFFKKNWEKSIFHSIPLDKLSYTQNYSSVLTLLLIGNVFNLSYEIKNCLFFLFSGLALISHHENCNFDMPSQMSFRRVESLSSLNFKTLSTTISYQKFFLPRSSINSASKWPRIQHTSLRPILL